MKRSKDDSFGTEPWPAGFLNVDLDVYSSRPLDELVQAVERRGAHTLDSGPWHKGGFRAVFEVNKRRLDADTTIKELGRILRGLPRSARTLFDRATRRDFSIGLQSAAEPFSFEVTVSPTSLGMVSELGGRLTVVVYAPARPSEATPLPGKSAKVKGKSQPRRASRATRTPGNKRAH